MITCYKITKAIHDALKNDRDVNTVVIGDTDSVDMDKQTIFPLAHVLIQDMEFLHGFNRFSIVVSMMDLVDETKENITEIPADERWKGQDNRQDILNTTSAVLEKLVKFVENTLSDDGYYLESKSKAVPFELRFKNLLAGWDMTFVIDVPNTVQNCN